MVTLMWQSPLYLISSTVSKSRVISVICHHSLATKDWQTRTDAVGTVQEFA
jgi:hypothetical protein